MTISQANLGNFLAGIGVFLGVCGALVAWLVRVLGRVHQVHDEIVGHPARQGVEAKPSMGERLTGLEDYNEKYAPALDQLFPNGGSSVVDRIQKIELKLGI